MPSTTYKKEIANSSFHNQHQPVLKPRNTCTKQVVNIQWQKRQQFWLTHDALYTLHQLAFDHSGFVAKITTYPDLMVACGMPCMMQELESVLISASKSPSLLSYDTTFQLGDIYLSPPQFHHTLYVTNPVMPTMFLIHEQKFQKFTRNCQSLLVKQFQHWRGQANESLWRPMMRREYAMQWISTYQVLFGFSAGIMSSVLQRHGSEDMGL